MLTHMSFVNSTLMVSWLGWPAGWPTWRQQPGQLPTLGALLSADQPREVVHESAIAVVGETTLVSTADSKAERVSNAIPSATWP